MTTKKEQIEYYCASVLIPTQQAAVTRREEATTQLVFTAADGLASDEIKNVRLLPPGGPGWIIHLSIIITVIGPAGCNCQLLVTVTCQRERIQ
jgi:hypothetical protein